MYSESVTQPTIRSIVLGISLAVVLLVLLCRLGDIVKIAGTVLLWLPSQLGLVQQVQPGQVLYFDLQQKDNTWQVTQPGRYAVYTANDNLLEMSTLMEASDKTWLQVTTDGGASLPVDPVRRGLSIVDSLFVPGRPVYTIAVANPGLYNLVHPHPAAQMAIVPDYVSGREVTIYLVLGLQLLAVGGLIAMLFYRRYRKQQERRARWRPRDAVVQSLPVVHDRTWMSRCG